MKRVMGVVGGVYYGLKAAAANVCLVTSYGELFLNVRLVVALLAALDGDNVAAPLWQGWLRPLHAVYRRGVVSPFKTELGQRGAVIQAATLRQNRNTNVFEEKEIRRIDPRGLSFVNLITPEACQSASRQWRSRVQ